MLIHKIIKDYTICIKGGDIMLNELIPALAVSLDTFLAAAAYRSSSIRIPAISVLVISIVSAAVLGLSLGFSGILTEAVDPQLCRSAGMIILIVIGTAAIFKSVIRSLIKKISGDDKPLQLSGFGLAVSIYLDDTAADMDRSKILSPQEAAIFALASSLDSAAIGINYGFSGISPLITALLGLICTAAAILAGGLAAKKISSLRRDFSWTGGVLLIILAIAGK